MHITGGLLATGGQSFGVGDPVGLFEKFEFDLRRVIDNTLDDPRGYDVMNAALDAWHMVDWLLTWAEFKGDLRDFMASYFGLEKVTKHAFTIRVKALCPRLGLCQTVSNASKHARIKHTNPGYNPSLVTTSFGGGGFMFGRGQMRTLWTIEDANTWLAADAVLIDVFHFWRDFLLAGDLIDMPDGADDRWFGILWKLERGTVG